MKLLLDRANTIRRQRSLARALLPFLRVHSVKDQSPAHESGLKEGDLIFQFGTSITHATANPLTAIAQSITNTAETAPPLNEETPEEAVTKDSSRTISIDLLVLRPQEGKTYTLPLTPRKWKGPGLVGFHIVPC